MGAAGLGLGQKTRVGGGRRKCLRPRSGGGSVCDQRQVSMWCSGGRAVLLNVLSTTAQHGTPLIDRASALQEAEQVLVQAERGSRLARPTAPQRESSDGNARQKLAYRLVCLLA